MRCLNSSADNELDMVSSIVCYQMKCYPLYAIIGPYKNTLTSQYEHVNIVNKFTVITSIFTYVANVEFFETKPNTSFID